MLAIGLMSGTSLDGVDAALVDIEGHDEKTQVRLVRFCTLPMPQVTRGRVLSACRPGGGTSRELCSLNVELGHLFSQAVALVCREAGIADSEVSFVASHGQTIWHNPVIGAPTAAGADGEYSGTLQLGDPAVIAWDHNVTVVSDFRPMDMAAGGQGAPLVPFSEVVLYGDGEKSVALLNVGGIGNVTVLPAGRAADGAFAFDTGPGNMMIDEVCRRLLGTPFDDGGRIAASGRVDGRLLGELMSNPYLKRRPPKSTGRELFGAQAVSRVLDERRDLSAEDLVATLTEFTAASVADACSRFVVPRLDGGLDRLVVGGGGAHNATLVSALGRLMPQTEVLTQEDLGFSSDAKEAIAFAILGTQTLTGRPSNVPSATGASCPVILGNVTYPPRVATRAKEHNEQEE